MARLFGIEIVLKWRVPRQGTAGIVPRGIEPRRYLKLVRNFFA